MSVIKILFFLIIALVIVFFLLGLLSQKGNAPGLDGKALSPCSSKPNCVSSEDGTQPEKLVKPLQANMKQARAAIMATGGTITSETDHYISATYMSKIFKFIDDVEIRDNGDGQVHIRSSSRVGYSDRGANKKRVATIRAALHE